VTGPALVEAVGCMTGVCMTEVAVGTEGEGDGVPLGEASDLFILEGDSFPFKSSLSSFFLF